MSAVNQELRKRLQEERSRLKEEIDRLKNDNPLLGEIFKSESGGYGNHMADDASDTFELEKTLALRINLENLLKKTERALQKLDEGTYGLCDECDSPIDPARLEVLPQANLCIRCKARQEMDVKIKSPRKK